MTFRKMTYIVASLLPAVLPANAALAEQTWQAELAPLNTSVGHHKAGGTATFRASGDTLTIKIDAKGTPPGIMHLQHFHGFAEGDNAARCPTSKADANSDGFIDLIETEPVAGTSMVPFHADPVSMDIVVDTYPTAKSDGSYSYEQSVSLSGLQAAFEKAFPGQKLDLERRVVFLHSVPDSVEFPESVQSLGEVPANLTLPIACGEIQAANG